MKRVSPSAAKTTAVSTTTAAPDTSGRPPRVRLIMGSDLKLKLVGPGAHHPHAFAMSAKQFVTLKNGGKRTGSNKVTDPLSNENFAYQKNTRQFYAFDKTQLGNKGEPVTDDKNRELLDRLENGRLLDRKRKDRNNDKSPLMPFDVGPYGKNLPINSHLVLKKLPTGGRVWDSNNDHSPAGASIDARNGGKIGNTHTEAYKQGIAIAIPNPTAHIPYSPTWGSGRHGAKDTSEEHDEIRRVDYDKSHPAAAAYRDIRYMIENTHAKDLSIEGTIKSNPSSNRAVLEGREEVRERLDLNIPANRLTQIAGYRYLLRQNQKLHTKFGDGRGINLEDKAVKYTYRRKPSSKGESDNMHFTYRPIPDRTQGQEIARWMKKRLVNESLAHPVEKPGGLGVKRGPESSAEAPSSKRPRPSPGGSPGSSSLPSKRKR